MTFRDDRRREKRVPFAFSGEFPVYRGFEGSVGPVDVQTLTLGGTELTMKVLFKNLNGFSVSLTRLAYKLELVGRPVAEGTFGEEKTVAGGARPSSPCLLSWISSRSGSRSITGWSSRPSPSGSRAKPRS